MKYRILSLLILLVFSLLLTACGEGEGGATEDIVDEGNAGGDGQGGGSPSNGKVFRVLAANDLGMHCADRDYQIMSILPPFNNVHAQLIQKGTSKNSPKIISDKEADLFYSATSSLVDPAGANSINTTSSNREGVFKSNFWQGNGNGMTLAGAAYGSLYPATVFSQFEPLPVDKGIPVPDPVSLPQLLASQQIMPGTANHPQKFARFDQNVPFFKNFPFGSTISSANWFAADGIPMSPIDDKGRENAYPLMRVAAKDKKGNKLGSIDVVLPTASEADCQNCHADPNDAGNGLGSSFASADFNVISKAQAPGPEKLNNAAKINILRLHDAKHGADYVSSVDGSAAPCDASANPSDSNCLANQTPVQCSQCHYSPALDLAQVGPIDDNNQGAKGRQQTRHISMSRAMHFTHGSFKNVDGKPLFPDMPNPADAQRNQISANKILGETCYQCHPGKKTQCLRGAMFKGGVVCQDCHGNMKNVGNDFSAGLASGIGLDLTKRVPWASEPKCQSCHTGDAFSPNHPAGAIIAKDGLRLAQAYLPNNADAQAISSPTSRFAENQSLFRLSGNKDGSEKGHGGVMCEGCHGSTHAIWPSAKPNGNDNIAAKQIQGHAGTITECVSCHEAGSLGNTLGGPHGMHPVGGTGFANGGHEHLAKRNPDNCRACHGKHGEGSVLSRVSKDRSFSVEDAGRINLHKGQQVSCTLCHSNKL